MRLLLDENLPIELAPLLAGHEVRTVGQMGWLRMKNGELLDAAEAEFDALLTLDYGILFQQDHRDRRLRIAVLSAHSSRIERMTPLLPHIETFLSQAEPLHATISESGIEPAG